VLDDTTLSLIEQIYRTVLEPLLPPEMVARIGKAVGGVQECLISSSIGLGSFSQIAPRRDPAFLPQVHEYWTGGDVPDGVGQFGAALASMPASRVLDIRQVLDGERFARTDFYNEWWRPQGLGAAALAVRFATPGDTIGFYGVHKPPGDGGFSSAEAGLFGLVAPHLARAISIRDAMASLSIEKNLSDVGSGRGILLVGHAGRLVFADEAGEAWLRDSRGLRLENGVVTTCDADAARTLARLVASCSDAGIGENGPGGTLAMPHPDGPAFSVTVVPFRLPENGLGRAYFCFPRPAAILVVSDPTYEWEERKARLRRDYNLTVTEAEFTLEILKGDGREAAARRMGISLSTARTHLMRIFGKTGCRRQTELMRLLADKSF
jgi:DNA-binding CsgD family transcriptional regulator